MLQHVLLDVSHGISSDKNNLGITSGISLGINLVIMILLLLVASYLSCWMSPLAFLQKTLPSWVPIDVELTSDAVDTHSSKTPFLGIILGINIGIIFGVTLQRSFNFGINLGMIIFGIIFGINFGIIINYLCVCCSMSCWMSPLAFLQTTSTPRVPFFESDLGSAWALA